MPLTMQSSRQVLVMIAVFVTAVFAILTYSEVRAIHREVREINTLPTIPMPQAPQSPNK